MYPYPLHAIYRLESMNYTTFTKTTSAVTLTGQLWSVALITLHLYMYTYIDGVSTTLDQLSSCFIATVLMLGLLVKLITYIKYAKLGRRSRIHKDVDSIKFNI